MFHSAKLYKTDKFAGTDGFTSYCKILSILVETTFRPRILR